jgi:hypothetical protein
MFYVLQNESTAALRRVPILLTDAATGTTAQTGIAITNIYPSVNINGGAFAGGAGTVAEAGYGQYYYQFDATEVATLGLAGIHVTAVGCRDYDAIAQVAAFNVYSASGVGITAADVWNYDISGVVGAGLAGSQLNVAASGGGTTTGDIATAVWDYAGATVPATVKETLETASTQAGNAAGNTGTSQIRDAVWDTDVSYLTSPQAGAALYQAALGTTQNAPSEVWSYVTREITGGLANTVTTVTNPVEVSTAAMAGIANTVWSTDISGYTTAGTAGSQLNLAAAPSGAGITAGDVTNAVWNVATSSYTTSGTFGHNILRSDVAGTAGTVSLWTGGAYSGIFADTYRIDEDYNAAIALKDILTGIGASITGNITGDLSGSVGSVTADVNVSTASMSGIANTVWSTDISGYTSPSAGYDLANASSGAGITAGDVWDFNITGFGGTNSAAVYVTDTNFTVGNIETYVSTQTPQDVWTYAGIEGRTITGGIADTVTTVVNGVTVTTNNDKTGYSLTSTQTFDLTGNITGNLSGSVGSVTSDVPVDEAAISADVWSYVTRTLTSGSGISAYDVWNFDPTAMTVPAAGAILTDIQTDTNQIQTDIGNIPNNVWASDVSGYSTPGEAGFELTQAAAGSGLTTGDIWNYTLTSSGVSADATLGNADDQATNAATNTNSPTLEANVWSYATRTITGGIVTSVGDKTGYSLSGTQSFNLTGNITGSVSGSVGSVTGSVGSVVNPVLVATASMSGIANTVWTNASRTITGGAVTSVVDPVTVSLNSMSGIAGTVWTYSPRTLTSGAGSTAGDIWNYNISGITASGTAGAVLNDASVSGSVVTIVNGPYRLTSIAEGTDGRIDILADSVQTIQLNCLDGFGQPFNVTGYAVVVNVYDVSGALTVTYTPTVDFASSGIVSFDIDTDVTGTTGRYTLVVELTAGSEVVQLGPLEILVRPL